jgi:predicted secreted protein
MPNAAHALFLTLAACFTFVAGLAACGQPFDTTPTPAPTNSVSCSLFQSSPTVTREISIDMDEAFTVELCSNATTGFLWDIPQGTGPSLTLVNHEAVPPDPSSAVGSAGLERFTFRPLDNGVTNLQFRYRRLWETGNQEAWRLDLKVTVH